MRHKYLLIAGLGLLGCSNGERSADTQTDSLSAEGVFSALTLDEYQAFYDSDSNAVRTGGLADLTIDFDCAVLIYPTEVEIKEMKKEYGEEDFYIIADDNNWYQAKTIQKLESVGIKMAGVHGDSLRFKGESQTWGFDMKKDSLSGWNVILFSRTKGPMVVSTVDVTVSELRDYFDLKE